MIRSEEGGEIGAHRCILAARLDYFRSMFGLGWIETRQGQSLTLPVPLKVGEEERESIMAYTTCFFGFHQSRYLS